MTNSILVGPGQSRSGLGISVICPLRICHMFLPRRRRGKPHGSGTRGGIDKPRQAVIFCPIKTGGEAQHPAGARRFDEELHESHINRLDLHQNRCWSDFYRFCLIAGFLSRSICLSLPLTLLSICGTAYSVLFASPLEPFTSHTWDHSVARPPAKYSPPTLSLFSCALEPPLLPHQFFS